MAYLTQPDYVKYVCSCGQLKPITSLYFCRHCLKIRCGFCICHEVDSHYCANCLENMPSSEARLKKNRCSSCFDCPSCFHTLSTRATLAQPRQNPQDIAAGGDAKVENKQPKKMYYLSCFNCRWTSRDVGIPDQPVASGGWPERTNPSASRVNQLLDYYKAIALQEKQEKLERERKKFSIRGKYLTLTDKTGLTGAMARNIAGMPSSDGGSSSAIAGFTPSQASAEVLGLPDDIFTKDVNLKQITSMSQRLASAEWQPSLASRLHPLAKLLSVKRSQRCRHCDHNLTKPEYNPGSIKFKIELLAYYHVPEVKIISFEPVKPGATSALLIKVTNPTTHDMTLRILPADHKPAEDEQPPSIDKSLDKSLNIDKDTSLFSACVREPSLSCSSRVTTPEQSVIIARRDDAAEYDDDAQQDAGGIIMWRKSNKLALRLRVETDATVEPGTPASAAFTLQYSYRNTVPPAAAAHKDHTLHTTSCLLELPSSSKALFRPPEDCAMCAGVDDVVRVANITARDFEEKYAYKSVPVIVTDATKNWPAMKEFNFNFFADFYSAGKMGTQINDCFYFAYKSGLNSLQEVFSMDEKRANLSGEPWYVGWSTCYDEETRKLRAYYTRPYFLPPTAESDMVDWVFMGGPGQGAHMHVDSVRHMSWQAQVRGHKQWVLAPPPECLYACVWISFTVNPGDILVVDTNRWYHKTNVLPGDISITIGAEYD